MWMGKIEIEKDLKAEPFQGVAAHANLSLAARKTNRKKKDMNSG